MICPWKLFFSGNISNQKNLQQIKKIQKYKIIVQGLHPVQPHNFD